MHLLELNDTLRLSHERRLLLHLLHLNLVLLRGRYGAHGELGALRHVHLRLHDHVGGGRLQSNGTIAARHERALIKASCGSLIVSIVFYCLSAARRQVLALRHWNARLLLQGERIEVRHGA